MKRAKAVFVAVLAASAGASFEVAVAGGPDSVRAYGSGPNPGRPVPGRPVPTRPSPYNAAPTVRSVPDPISKPPAAVDNGGDVPADRVTGGYTGLKGEPKSGCRWMAQRAVQTKNNDWWARYRACIASQSD